MSENKKKKRTKYYTDKLKCLYPRITKPDNKFPKPGQPDGEYSIQLIATPEQVDALIEKVKAEAEAQAEEVRKSDKKYAKWNLVYPVKDQEDKDTGDKTGLKIIKLAQAATVEPKDKSKDLIKFKVTIADKHGKPVANPESLKVGSGSIVKCCFEVRVTPNNLPAYKNLQAKFQLKAVQIIDLVSYTGEDFAFEEEEGNFEAGAEVPNGDSPSTSEGGEGGEEKPNADF